MSSCNLNKSFEDMHLRQDQRPQHRHYDNQVVLPPCKEIMAMAGRGELPLVQRPEHMPTLTYAHPLNNGYPSSYSAGQPSPTYATLHRQFAHASIESSPSTAFSSPRALCAEQAYETSSTSSRESSTFPSNVSTAARNGSSHATKRGSESQGSHSGRQAKRPSTASNSGESDNEDWCTKCDRAYDLCGDNSKHKKSQNKIRKEQGARRNQAASLQIFEDKLNLYLGWSARKSQKPGNEKKSGLAGDKQEIIDAYDILNDVLMENSISPLPLQHGETTRQAIQREAWRRIDAHQGREALRVLPRDSLMAADTESGENLCPGTKPDGSCPQHESPIECRKRRRAAIWDRKVGELEARSAARRTSTARSSPAGSKSSSSTIKRK